MSKLDRIAIVGGGPAGLYLSILLKKNAPDIVVDLYERNTPGDAFGFGVVFSDETLENIEAADEDFYRSLTATFRHWGDIEVRHFSGRVIRSGGHGFAAVGRRTMLELLTARAKEVGTNLHFSAEVDDLAKLGDADVIVGADGAHSVTRNLFPEAFRPSVDLRHNKYIWLGTDRVFDDFTFIFEDTPAGMVWAHVYPFSDDASTFIVEMAPSTWRDLGLDANEGREWGPQESDELALKRSVDLFADHLDGARLIGNKSRWLQFPTIECEKWSHDNIVLMGDAVHTAHFSVGSGTKLALEDAISLSGHLLSNQTVTDALAAFETERRPVVESTQRAAKASLQWFEGADRYRGMEPEQFVFSMLTRSQRVTYDNLRLRDPGYMAEVDRWYAASEHGAPVPTPPEVPPMFHPFQLRDLTLASRIVVSPMDQYSAVDGMPNEWHLVHLGSRAVGGAGLVMTEMTCVSPQGRISPGCTGIWTSEQADYWSGIVDFIHNHTNAAIGLQIGHSGRKGSTKLMWEGDSEPLEQENWGIISPSPIRYRPDSQVPREMTREDMDVVAEQHVAAAGRGAEAGFDLLELHYAHGYLLSSFLTPLANQRNDEYGGSLQNRMRFPLELFDRVREAWPADRPISVRISATDWVEGG
ncbi:MAG: FAD-dependent monooxygenase, partial [Acidimicrobiia bacterium]